MACTAPRAMNPDAFVFVTENGAALHHNNFMADHFVRR